MSKHFAAALVILLILVALYFGAYYATVTNGVVFGHGMWNTFPSYNTGWDDDEGTVQEAAKVVFTPAHSLDRRLRPKYWSHGTLADGTFPDDLPGGSFF